MSVFSHIVDLENMHLIFDHVLTTDEQTEVCMYICIYVCMISLCTLYVHIQYHIHIFRL